MSVQTEKRTMRAVSVGKQKSCIKQCCPNKTNRSKTNKTFYSYWGNIDVFKNKAQKLTTIDQKINEFEPYNFSNVKIKAMKEGEMKRQKMKIS